jgi:hypothetical protein
VSRDSVCFSSVLFCSNKLKFVIAIMILLWLFDEMLIEEDLSHLSLFFILKCYLRLLYCQHDLLSFFYLLYFS